MIGMCHGHQVVPQGDQQSLLALKRKLGVDLLLTASTHELSIQQVAGSLLMDPGSATGAPTILHDNPPPSFIVMDVSAGKVRAAVMWLNKLIVECFDPINLLFNDMNTFFWSDMTDVSAKS